MHVRKLHVALAGTPCDGLIQTVHNGDYRFMAGIGGTTAAHAAETVGMQLEATTRKVKLPAYGHIPTTRSFGPVQLSA